MMTVENRRFHVLNPAARAGRVNECYGEITPMSMGDSREPHLEVAIFPGKSDRVPASISNVLRDW
jgi:hypothetical protein